MVRRLVVFLFVAGVTCSALAAEASRISIEKRAFNVLDSIAWNHIVNFDGDLSSNPDSGTALFSPNQSRFLVRLKHGKIERNASIDRLLIFDAEAVRAYVASDSTQERMPISRVLVEREFVGTDDEVKSIHWIGDGEVGFISASESGVKQAFAVDVKTGAVTQLTRSDTDVVAFAYAQEAVVYWALAPPVSEYSVTVGHQRIGELIAGKDDPEWEAMQPLQLFVARRGGVGTHRANLPQMQILPEYRQISVSPSGQHAILLVSAAGYPPHWSQYELFNEERFGFSGDSSMDATVEAKRLYQLRYVGVDISTGEVKPLIDAPAGTVSQNNVPPRIFWTGDRTAIVSNTYLPLLPARRPGPSSRSKTNPAIVEIDTRTGAVAVIRWEEVPTREGRAKGLRVPRILSFSWDPSSLSLSLNVRVADGSRQKERFAKIRGRWSAQENPSASNQMEDLKVQMRQSLSERPAVFAVLGSVSMARLIFDPNPQADSLNLVSATVRQWTDSNGVSWSGGLLLPSVYKAGNRYPLVVQTHGFSPQRFLLDGPFPDYGVSAMSAQALANAGFVVLQVEDNRKVLTGDSSEGSKVAEGWMAGILALVDSGIVDAGKVGLIGFSRTGYHALHFLARYPNAIKAAVLSDSVQGGYVEFLTASVNNPDIENQLARMVGGKPWDGDMAAWFAQNPLYSLGAARVAIRLEENGAAAPYGFWETYAVLLRSGRPVDFVLFPKGGHLLKKPAERLISQGGSVDWLRFWLQGYEDSDDQKVGQYSRWRAMLKSSRADH